MPGRLGQAMEVRSFPGEVVRTELARGVPAQRVAGVSIVVPVYNSEATLAALVERLERVLVQVAERHEVLLVNDGSRDSSWRVVQSLARSRPSVRGIDMLRNYGQHNALLCGIRAARFEVVVTLDDDLQNPPEEIPRLIAELEAGVDVVYGAPERERHGFVRDLASRATKLALQKSMGAETARSVTAFRAFRTELRSAFADYRNPYVSIDVLLTWATTRFRAIRVRHDERAAGRSNYTWRKLAVHALNMITGFTVLPLQLAGLVGFAFAAFGIGVLAYVVGRYMLYGSPVQGFTFLTSIVAIFSGAQLFALGIIGEYLARMHFRTMDRPSYAVRSETPPR